MRQAGDSRVKENRIIAFAGKDVGRETLLYLLKKKAPVERVVLAAPDSEFASLLQKHRIRVELYDGQTQKHLVRENLRYGWLLNLWSPHILRPGVLKLASHRLNIHPGLVPTSRGTDNASWMIRNGLPVGVSLLEMTDTVDGGSVYAVRPLRHPFPIRGSELHRHLKKACIQLFKDNWDEIYAGDLAPRPQKGKGHAYKRKDTERDRRLSAGTQMTLDDFLKWALAHDFEPGTMSEAVYPGATYEVRVALKRKK